MKLSKRLMLPMCAIALLGAGAVGAAGVSAATDPSSDSLAQKLATTFNLDQKKVQAVIDQDRSEYHVRMEARLGARLTQAVKDGKLTEAQKQAILAKAKEVKSQVATAKADNQTLAERRAAMDKLRGELEAWAKANDIGGEWLMFARSHGGPGHHGLRHGEVASADIPIK
jgi:hypothetical protein